MLKGMRGHFSDRGDTRATERTEFSTGNQCAGSLGIIRGKNNAPDFF